MFMKKQIDADLYLMYNSYRLHETGLTLATNVTLFPLFQQLCMLWPFGSFKNFPSLEVWRKIVIQDIWYLGHVEFRTIDIQGSWNLGHLTFKALGI